MTMKRKPLTVAFSFSGSATGVSEGGAARAAGDPVDVSEYAFGGIHVTSGLNGRTVTFKDSGPWGTDDVLEKAVSTGFNALTSDEILALGPSLNLTCELDTSATGTLYLKLKS